ncbi:hypothetical protein [Flavobacterium difficile]|uniref:Lipoprotein n=1 Tax=Flavobacterium difficile TaxID=2709659 RepID=A0ABX0I7J6_9FLAO|nr:hypothetical protein [Flavobacterium difficile]NHM02158.1 hypothetical protein [Flavobacterium difficile]
MKKLLISLGLSIAILFALYYYKPIVIKYLIGNATILDKAKYYVSIDDKLYKDVLYENKDTFILYLKNENTSTDFSIISIDLKNNIVAYNCSSSSCYDMFLGNLFQSDMGKKNILFENISKGPNFKTNLKIYETKISFYIPNNEKNKFVELMLKESCEN